jgi:hypothetical protein
MRCIGNNRGPITRRAFLRVAGLTGMALLATDGVSTLVTGAHAAGDIPPIDEAAPTNTQTGTFALG